MAEDVLKKRKSWISQEVVQIINEREKFKSTSDVDGKQKYCRLRNEIIRKS